MYFSLSVFIYLIILSFRNFVEQVSCGFKFAEAEAFNPFKTEASPLICGANRWTGFYMIMTSVLKGLNIAQHFQGISLFALFHTGDVSLVNHLFCIHLFRICEELFKQN